MRLITSGCLALGLMLSMLTQLRPDGVPLGPGEAFLMMALGMLAAQTLFGLSPRVTPAISALLLFWSVFIAAESIGFVFGGLIGDQHDTGLVLHDAATYPILIATTLLCAVDPDASQRLHQSAWCIAVLGSLLCILQLANAVGLFALPNIDPWYWDRLRGWTANPNQFALYCLIIGLLSLYLLGSAHDRAAQIGASCCAIIAIGAGTFAKTNASNLALAAGAIILIGIKVSTSLLHSRRQVSFGSFCAWTLILGLPIALAAAVPFVKASPFDDSFVERLGRDNPRETDSESKLRLELWQTAVNRAFDSDLLGLGPGPHLPIPPVLLNARWGEPFEPSNVVHPDPSGPPNFEAHNSILELFVQGGALAVAAFLGIVSLAFVTALKTHNHCLATSLIAILLFGSFHVITRHPAFWYIIVACLVARDSALDLSQIRFGMRLANSRG